MLHALLLLEDDEPLAASLLATLPDELPGVRLAYASTMADAVAILRNEPIDIAIADLGLPGARGLSPLYDLRAVAPDLPILVLTGTHDPGLVARATSMHGISWMYKGQRISADMIAYRLQLLWHEVRGDEEVPTSAGVYDHTETLRRGPDADTNQHPWLAHQLADWKTYGLGLLVVLAGLITWAFLDLKTKHEKLEEVSNKRSEIIERLEERSMTHKMRMDRLEQYLYGRSAVP